MDDYNVIEIPSKHGIIRLHVPKRETNQEEMDAFYQVIAEVLLNSYKEQQQAAKKN